MCAIQRETDTSLMQEKLSTLMNWLSNSEHAKAMAKYMPRHHTQKCEMWARYHRFGFGIDTNMFMEAFHKVFRLEVVKASLDLTGKILILIKED